MKEHIEKEVAGIRRHAILQSPEQREDGRPLLILLHGKGGTAQWALEETLLSELAEREKFHLLAPDAQALDPMQEPKFLTNPQLWNTDPKNEFAALLPDDVAFIDRLLTDVLARTEADPNRVYVSGFSNGAAMTFRLAIELGHRLAAIAPIAGMCLIDPIPRLTKSVPTIWVLGRLDPLMPIDGGQVLSPWGRSYHRPPVRDEAARWSEANGWCLEDEDFQIKILDDLGHHWPGGLGRLNPKLFGPPNREFQGNEIIWNFLSKYRRAT